MIYAGAAFLSLHWMMIYVLMQHAKSEAYGEGVADGRNQERVHARNFMSTVESARYEQELDRLGTVTLINMNGANDGNE